MTLAPGTLLGPYEIVAPLGAGGMGEVYRARDARLGREVAVKVLPQHLGANPEVRSRFEREASTIAALNHPHICVLHDVGREGDTDYLVMELIEGETLAERLAKGPLPTDEAVRLGVQIADALERAHRAGVVHRDLKPGNVMLTRTGAKLMDFGLARVAGFAGRDAPGGTTVGAMSHSPTVAAPLTAEGAIVGTFQYMAPEQLEGKEADARSDLWALGCVLYEMATGRQAFEGDSQASLVGSIMRDTPRSVDELAPASPRALGRVVGALLAKHPDERIQTAHDAKLQLQWVGEVESDLDPGRAAAPTTGATGRRRTAVVPWVIAGIALASALGLAARLLLVEHVGMPVSSAIVPPPGVTFSSPTTTPVPLAVSPDGTQIAYCAHAASGPDRLWVRSLATGEARPLVGTEGAETPFFSPDGKSIAFFSNGKLRRVDAGGGPVITLADAPDPRGGTWGGRGVIVFAARGQSGLSKVRDDGGEVSPATVLDDTLREATHRHPHFLPDGVHFLYLARRAGAGKGEEPVIYAASIESSERTHVVGVASNVAYASGYLLYVEQGNLVAHAFDLGRRAVQGSAIPISDAVRMDTRFSRGTFAVSQNGVLAFMTGQAQSQSIIQWVNRDGESLGNVGDSALYTFGGTPRIDPSGRRAAMGVLNAERGISDIWIVDLDTGLRRRLSVDDEDHYACTWSPDGSRIVMNVLLRRGGSALASMDADGMGAPRIVWTTPGYVYPGSVSPDGRWVIVSTQGDEGSYDVLAISLTGQDSIPVAVGPAVQTNAVLSPDGRFIAYTSDESGRVEVYLAAFPPPGGRFQASTDGGAHPRWSRDGKELFYVDTDNFVTSIPLTPSGAGLEFGTPRRLFQVYGSRATSRYDVAADGQRFLVTIDVAGASELPITLMTQWVETLER